MQIKENIKDSNELLYKDFMTVGENVNVPYLVQTYVDNQMETYQWLKDCGVKFLSITVASGQTVPRSHMVMPGDVVKILSDLAKAKGAKLLMKTAAQRLVVDEKTGKVRGVEALRNGKEVYYEAKKGVLLSSGGFSFNKELLARFVPHMVYAKALGGLGNVGDGLKMAWELGADLRDMPYIKATFGFDLEAKNITHEFSLFIYNGAILVNKDGKRIVNESKSYKLVGDAALVQKDHMGYQLFDAKIRETALKDSRTKYLEEHGRIASAPTLQELADKISIPAGALEATVKEYNAGVEKGVDSQFGRTTLVAGYGKPSKIDQGPYYAFPSTAYIIGTYGGILIDKKAQVLDIFGNGIPGLYAAGEITGGIHGGAYMTGTAFGKALIFGRLAAKSMLAAN
jgi:fumarate reductase flavoprotein subunit